MTELRTDRQPFTDNAERMDAWCLMWNEDPTLAYRLMSEDCVQFSGQTTALDAVVGPQAQDAFITAYRAEHANVFTPRSLVDAEDVFAYDWDVRLPDGTMHTGMDVNVVVDGMIHENWTFVGPHIAETDPEPSAVAADTLAAIAAAHVPEPHRPAVLDPARGRFAVLYTSAGADGTPVACVDLVAVRAGQVERVRTFVGIRSFSGV